MLEFYCKKMNNIFLVGNPLLPLEPLFVREPGGIDDCSRKKILRTLENTYIPTLTRIEYLGNMFVRGSTRGGPGAEPQGAEGFDLFRQK